MQSRYRGRVTLFGYLIGAGCARTGDELSAPALLLLGLTMTGSPAAASALLAALTIAAAAGGPVLGAYLDASRHPGRTLAFVLAGYSAGLAAILLALPTLPLPAVLALAALTGLANPAVAGGWTAQLPAVLGDRTPARGQAMDAMTFGLAALLGPALAGLVGGLTGGSSAMMLAAALVAGALPAARALPRRASPPVAVPLRTRLREGFGVVLTRRPLLRATVTSMISYTGIGMAMVCYPLLGQAHLGGAGHGTALLAVVAGAGMAANAVLARRPPACGPDRLLLATTLVIATGLAVTAATGEVVALVAGAALTGLGEGPQLTALFGVRHREAPESARAQVFTTAASLKIAAFAAGVALAGPLASASPAHCLAAAACAQLLAAGAYLLLRVRPAGYRLRKPSPGRGA
ncbi:MFS transporter [Amycolatopsis antarctica]|uniref:MFS transporter n=1 Tax=Amycolatopsis antarctica TaxID=1854586 RepID=UPI001F0A7F92|nr:MFS transporter [Amycolatopsis antarctica]